MSKKLAILGIERNNKGINHTDGSCEELINMRYDNGTWSPCIPVEALQSLDCLFSYHHPVLDGGFVFGVRGVESGVLAIRLQTAEGVTLSSSIIEFTPTETVKSIQHIGNMLYFHIVKTEDSRIVRLLWDGVQYVDLSDLPNAPEISSWDLQKKVYNDNTVSGHSLEVVDGVSVVEVKSVYDWLDDRDDDTRIINTNLYYSDIEKIESLVLQFAAQSRDAYNQMFNSQMQIFKAAEYYNGIFSALVCYEMYDGTYIKYGNPKVMYCPSSPIVDDGTTATISSKFKYPENIDEIIEYKHIGTPDVINTDELRSVECEFQFYRHIINVIYNIPSKYKNIVKNIVICATPLKWDDFNYYIEGNDSEFIDDIILSDSISLDDVFSEETYYVVKRISANYGSEQTEQFTFDYSHFENIRNGEALPVDSNQSNLNIFLSRSGKFGVYNKRLILNGVSFDFPDFDFNQVDLVDAVGTTLYAIVELSINNVPYYVISAILDKTLQAEDGNYKVLLYYPDVRAQRIIFIDKTSGVEQLRLDEAMTQYANYGYLFGLFAEKSTAASVNDYLDYQQLLELNDTMRVSKVNNPFVFPTENSFTFDGDILGSAVATHATSDGQFGQFPLTVLHTRGIDAMEVGSGDVSFSRIVPLSREVCTNGDSIHGTEIGILFVDSDGLKLLVGRDPVLLTDKVDNIPSVGIRDDLNYQLFTGESGAEELLARFPAIHPLLSTDNILEYLQGAIVKYVGTKEKNIIVTNPNKAYSYIISLAQSMIYKIEGSFKYLEDSYPVIYALDQDTLYNLSGGMIRDAKVFFETNPLSLQEYDWAIERLIVRGLLDATHETIVSGVYIYGSMDEAHWVKLHHYQINTKRKDIAISFTGGQFKWLKVVFSGWLNEGSYITHIELIPVPKVKDVIS